LNRNAEADVHENVEPRYIGRLHRKQSYDLKKMR
jgi:hypothetical protein